MKATQKTKSNMWCYSCGAKGVKLIRMFGTWPPVEFQDLSAKDQASFWESHAESDKELEDLVAHTLSKKMIEQEEDK